MKWIFMPFCRTTIVKTIRISWRSAVFILNICTYEIFYTQSIVENQVVNILHSSPIFPDLRNRVHDEKSEKVHLMWKQPRNAHIKFIVFYIGIFPQQSLNTDHKLRASSELPSITRAQKNLSLLCQWSALYAIEYCQHSVL